MFSSWYRGRWRTRWWKQVLQSTCSLPKDHPLWSSTNWLVKVLFVIQCFVLILTFILILAKMYSLNLWDLVVARRLLWSDKYWWDDEALWFFVVSVHTKSVYISPHIWTCSFSAAYMCMWCLFFSVYLPYIQHTTDDHCKEKNWFFNSKTMLLTWIMVFEWVDYVLLNCKLVLWWC